MFTSDGWRTKQRLLTALVGLLLAAIPVVGLPACQAQTPAWQHMQQQTITIANSKQQRVRLQVRIADDSEEMAAGFQYICPQQFRDNAILFIFRTPLQARFHMRNVYAPLDIAFVDNAGKILKIMTMRPAGWEKNGQSKLYGPAGPFRYALETRVGYFQEQAIEQGNSRLLLGKLLSGGD